MFKRSFRATGQSRVDKAPRHKRSGSFRDPTKLARLERSLTEHDNTGQSLTATRSPTVTLTVGDEGRLFAVHVNVLCKSPFFNAACKRKFEDAASGNLRISLPGEEPEVFSAVLEYLYKGDYYPRLLHNRSRNSWDLEDHVKTPHTSPNPAENGGGRAAAARTTPSSPSVAAAPASTVFVSSMGVQILRDTVIYCAADKYGLEELQMLALRKQGMQSGIDVGTILRSAQYAYAFTPDTDRRLRAHYLALIIRCRKTFKRSGTMQADMEAGGTKLYFDLFVAMCHHLDDVLDAKTTRSPRTV